MDRKIQTLGISSIYMLPSEKSLLKAVMVYLIDAYQKTTQTDSFQDSYATFIRESVDVVQRIITNVNNVSISSKQFVFLAGNKESTSVHVFLESTVKESFGALPIKKVISIGENDFIFFIDIFRSLYDHISDEDFNLINIIETIDVTTILANTQNNVESRYYVLDSEINTSNLDHINNKILLATRRFANKTSEFQLANDLQFDLNGNYKNTIDLRDLENHIKSPSANLAFTSDAYSAKELLRAGLISRAQNASEFSSVKHNRLQGITADGTLYEHIKNFKEFGWRTFKELIVSAITSYSYEFGGFDKLKICKQCSKLFYPERSGESRGLYCSDECRQKFYYGMNKNYEKCRTKHRQFIRIRLEALNDKSFNSISSSTLMPQSTECRKCQQHIATTIKTGECPILRTDLNFINLVSKYNEFRYNKKQKNQS